MTMFQMYLFTRLGLINMFSGLFSTIFGIATAIVMVMFFLTFDSGVYEEDHKITTKALKICCPLFIMNLFVYVTVPTQKEMAAIVVVPKILSAENVDKIQKIGSDGIDIVKLATEYTKGILENKTTENIHDHKNQTE